MRDACGVGGAGDAGTDGLAAALGFLAAAGLRLAGAALDPLAVDTAAMLPFLTCRVFLSDAEGLRALDGCGDMISGSPSELSESSSTTSSSSSSVDSMTVSFFAVARDLRVAATGLGAAGAEPEAGAALATFMACRRSASDPYDWVSSAAASPSSVAWAGASLPGRGAGGAAAGAAGWALMADAPLELEVAAVFLAAGARLAAALARGFGAQSSSESPPPFLLPPFLPPPALRRCWS
mmetsp:Transcript_20607/g.57190  ORF Transcript_20607/g.57190 Transcript_20607/m.57190 type:complete len:237 (-) Transcript_20607:47-757(-)